MSMGLNHDFLLKVIASEAASEQHSSMGVWGGISTKAFFGVDTCPR